MTGVPNVLLSSLRGQALVVLGSMLPEIQGKHFLNQVKLRLFTLRPKGTRSPSLLLFGKRLNDTIIYDLMISI